MKRFATFLTIGIIAFGIVYVLAFHTHLLVGFERQVLDGSFNLREPGAGETNPFVSDRAILLGYDVDAIAVIGKWPWKRYVHADFLKKIQRFSPETVFFDVIFAKPDEAPAYLRERLQLDPGMLSQLEQAFARMDSEFAGALKAYDNVYLDLQLIEQPRTGLPEAFQERIRLNENLLLKNYSLPADGITSPLVFRSLEPVLSEYASAAHPVVINVPTGNDGVIRMFPLFYTYETAGGELRNILTVASAMLLKYFHIGKENISIYRDRVVFRDAKTPRLDPVSKKTLAYEIETAQLLKRIAASSPPEGYSYNDNLYRLAAARFRGADGVDMFSLPVHVAVGADDRLEILKGWELLDAAKDCGAEKLQMVVYEATDVVVKTPLEGFYYINYAGTERVFQRDPYSGELRTYTPIPTDSYASVYTLPEMPDIPVLNDDGAIKAGQDTAALAQWFGAYCRQRATELIHRAAEELGEKAQDPDSLVDFMKNKTDGGEYFFYADFFSMVGDDGGEPLESLIAAYADYGRSIGLAESGFLSEKVVASALLAAYQEQFDRFYGKFVFTGGTATGMADVQQTPYASMYGVNVIINAFNTIATGNQLTFTSDLGRLDMWLLLGMCLACAVVFGLLDIRFGAIAFAAVFIGVFLVGGALFIAENTVLSVIPLAVGNIVVFAGVLIYKLLTEEKDKRFLKATFSSYLSPELIDEMHKNRAHPTLGGEAKVITAYFTDIQGFSTFSEKLTAPQLVELLNEYLSAMTDILIGEGGTLDKYEGDAIIAFFGAPMDLPDQELRACRTAIDMQKKLAELRDKWKAEKLPPGEENRNQRNVPEDQWPKGEKWPSVVHNMHMRIGINTGDVVVGNMGSTMRMNYTMMGDPVNLAARLESAAKQYGIYNLVSEYTLDVEFLDEDGSPQQVMNLVEVRYLDRITVVGKAEPVRVYELIGMKGEISADEKRLMETFANGMEAYLRMDWEKAIGFFSESYTLERYPFESTTPSEVFIKRCRAYKEKPPVAEGQEWDGVYRLTKK